MSEELLARASRMAWNPPRVGTAERKEMPKDVFLSPGDRTYPYKVKVGDKWVPSRKGLEAARTLAHMRGRPQIADKAEALLARYFPEDVEHGELMHAGVKGMKGGVIHDRAKDVKKMHKVGSAGIKLQKQRADFEKIIKKMSPKDQIQAKLQLNKFYDDNRAKKMDKISAANKAYEEYAKHVKKNPTLSKEYNSKQNEYNKPATTQKSAPSTSAPLGRMVDGEYERELAANEGRPVPKSSSTTPRPPASTAPVQTSKEYKEESEYNTPSTTLPSGSVYFTYDESAGKTIPIVPQSSKKSSSAKMYDEDVDNFLAHYGILGMKWGIRRVRDPRTGLVKRAGRPTADYKHARSLERRGLEKLSNEEIQWLNQRLQLERSYMDLTKKQKSKGAQFVDRMVVQPAMGAGSDLMKGVFKGAGKQIIEQLGIPYEASKKK